MSMFNDISRGSRDNEEECMLNEKKWHFISEDSPQGEWDNMAERMLLEFVESGCPIFRATTPLSRGQLKSKGHGKLSIHCAADLETIETIFRTIVSEISSVCSEQSRRCAKSMNPDPL